MGLAVNLLTRSLNVFHLAGSPCNNCDIEILDTLTPRYDLERFGIVLVGSVRHADVLLLSGAFNRKATIRAVEVYRQAAKPVVVVAIGNCACTANMFRGSYNVDPPIGKHIPIDAYLPGCPPKPEAMIAAVAKLIAKLRNG
ncbi:MAG: NADH:ubiquinone oxidoreductase [Planctomycetota bacterium]